MRSPGHIDHEFSAALPFGLSLVLALSVAAFALDATSADNLATGIISQLGRTKGFCAIPNCGNGQLARAFLQHSGMKVHATDADTANVTATRQLMEGSGLTSPNFYCDKGTTALIPYADRFADLIVITDLADADLANISYAEVERALCPSGLGWIGRATAEGAGITQAALQNWINAAAKTLSTATISTTNGTWAVISRKELSGVDVWPHRAYDVAGTRSSKDSVADFPWLPQARIKPYRGQEGSLVANGGRLYMAFPDWNTIGPANWLRVWNIYNGELLWTRNLTTDNISSFTGDFMTASPTGIYLQTGSGTIQLDGNTGAVVTPQTAPPADRPGVAFSTFGNGYGCGPWTASAKLTYRQMYAFGGRNSTRTALVCHNYKTPCQTGVAVSNGFQIFPGGQCECAFFRGNKLEAPAGSFQFDRSCAADGSDRLEKGPAWGGVVAQVVPDAKDWPTYRANTHRTGNTTVSVPAAATAPALMWNCRPAVNYVTALDTMMYDYRPEQEPTPAVVVGGYTFVCGSDGCIRCVNDTTAKQQWSYSTGGRIYASPTVANGCVYAGSCDGWAYCIEAHTGRLVWRFRAAPVDRRINLWGYLSSTWPVLGGVTIDNGKAYFAGGMQSEYGTHVYCVDALTGALVWQNNSSATSMVAAGRLGFAPQGYMAVMNGKLLATSGASPIAGFNLATGAQDPLPAEFTTDGGVPSGYTFNWTNWGQDLGVLDNGHIVYGGRHQFQDHRDRAGGGYQHNVVYYFSRVDANGTVLYPCIQYYAAMTTTPAWDGTDYYGTQFGTGTLHRYAVSDVAGKTDARCVADAGMVKNPQAEWNAWPAADSLFATPTWTNTAISINAMVLCPSGLVATYAKGTIDALSTSTVAEKLTWYVGLINRNTGASIWETALPDIPGGLKGEPLFGGLAIDRNGNIIVTQRNGNVLCYGNGSVVSVVRRDEPVQPSAPVAQPSTGAMAASTWGATSPAAGVHVSSASDKCEQPALTSDQSDAAGRPASVAAAHVACPVSVVASDHAQIPALEQTSLNDTSDMITFGNGVRGHTLAPEERAARAAYLPRDMTWRPERECLPIASVKATSSALSTRPSSTIDRDLTSRWTPSAAGPQSITYDLGGARDVAAVSVVWYAAKAGRAAFAIEVSSDGKRFDNVDKGTFTGRGTNTALRTFVPVNARYVRIVMDAPVSVYEVGIHGEANVDAVMSLK